MRGDAGVDNTVLDAAAKFDAALQLLPFSLRERARCLIRSDRAAAEEIRLRTGRRMSALLPDGELELGADNVTTRDLESVIEIATRASAHSVRESLRAGYITARGGCRIGICGTAYMREGEVAGIRDISSISVRIAREIKGAAQSVMRDVAPGGDFRSTLILSSPGGGKTTLVRDAARILSDGDEGLGIAGYRVALADERSEIAAVWGGRAQMDVGRRTDIMDGCRKADAVMMMLRAMNPEIIALDEITSPRDAEAVRAASYCGVKLLASAHAGSPEEFRAKPLYRQLLEEGIFEKMIFITRRGNAREYSVRDGI